MFRPARLSRMYCSSLPGIEARPTRDVNAAHLGRQRPRLRRVATAGAAAPCALRRRRSPDRALPGRGSRRASRRPRSRRRRRTAPRSGQRGAGASVDGPVRAARGTASSGRAARRASTRRGNASGDAKNPQPPSRPRSAAPAGPSPAPPHSRREREVRTMRVVVLSDRTIRRLIDEGRIGIDPVRPRADAAVEPRRARRPLLPRLPQLALSRSSTSRQAQEELTELVDRRRGAVHPPPRRVRARLDARAGDAARRPRREARREVEPRPPRPAHPLDRRVHRPRLGRPRDARALERRQPADHDLPGHEDRTALVRPALRAGRDALRRRPARLEVSGPAGADARAATGRTSSDDGP